MAKRDLGTHFLKQWREYRGLSLRKFASEMEIEPGVQLTSHANIGRIENFQQPYSQEILEAAAEALDCSVIEILTVDPTQANYSRGGREERFRAALVAYGVDPGDLHQALRAIKGFAEGASDDEQQSQDRSPARTAPANRRHAKAPSE